MQCSPAEAPEARSVAEAEPCPRSLARSLARSRARRPAPSPFLSLTGRPARPSHGPPPHPGTRCGGVARAFDCGCAWDCTCLLFARTRTHKKMHKGMRAANLTDAHGCIRVPLRECVQLHALTSRHASLRPHPCIDRYLRIHFVIYLRSKSRTYNLTRLYEIVRTYIHADTRTPSGMLTYEHRHAFSHTHSS